VKRVGNLMERVAGFGDLRQAFFRAAKGKRHQRSVARFFRDLEPELIALGRELRSGAYRPGPFETFTIRDPKERLISCPPFRDRVVHHAVIGALEPVLETRFDPDSYGCRKGRGLDAALKRAQTLAHRHAYVLRTDVRRFYDSIDLAVLRGQLRRIVKDRELLLLLDRILGPGTRGLPIGSLTSQWLANLYLTPLDRHLRSVPEARGQVRYMDDVLVFGESRETVKRVLEEVRAFLRDDLCLSLKRRATAVLPVGAGFPFLGFRVYPRRLEVRRETFRRFKAGLRRAEWEHRTGRLGVAELAASVTSRIAHLDRARSRCLRSRFLETRRAIEW